MKVLFFSQVSFLSFLCFKILLVLEGIEQHPDYITQKKRTISTERVVLPSCKKRKFSVSCTLVHALNEVIMLLLALQETENWLSMK